MRPQPESDPFEALGDENRRAIVVILSENSASVGEIADQMPISRPAVSRHLRLLRQAGLVTVSKDWTRSVYDLDATGIEQVREFIEAMWGDATARFRLFAENKGER